MKTPDMVLQVKTMEQSHRKAEMLMLDANARDTVDDEDSGCDVATKTKAERVVAMCVTMTNIIMIHDVG